MKVYAMSDLHGQGELFRKALKWMEQESNGEFLCYFLGDAIDRGPDGWEIMNYLLDHPDQFVYIKGNHEDLFVNSMKEYLQICDDEGYTPMEYATRCGDAVDIMFGGPDMMLHYRNGGESTFNSWLKAGCPRKYIQLLSELSVFEELSILDGESETVSRIYDFCHAGCKMQEWNDEDEEAAIWSREHFFQKWNGETDGVKHILVHGHTPICHMPMTFRKENGAKATQALRYNEGTKIDLDCACFHYGCLNLFDIGEDVFRQFYTTEQEELRTQIQKSIEKNS